MCASNKSEDDEQKQRFKKQKKNPQRIISDFHLHKHLELRPERHSLNENKNIVNAAHQRFPLWSDSLSWEQFAHWCSSHQRFPIAHEYNLKAALHFLWWEKNKNRYSNHHLLISLEDLTERCKAKRYNWFSWENETYALRGKFPSCCLIPGNRVQGKYWGAVYIWVPVKPVKNPSRLVLLTDVIVLEKWNTKTHTVFIFILTLKNVCTTTDSAKQPHECPFLCKKKNKDFLLFRDLKGGWESLRNT